MSDSQSVPQPEPASAPEVTSASSDVPKKRRRTLVVVVGLVVIGLCLCVGLCVGVYIVPWDSPVRMLLVDQPAVSAVADQLMRGMEKKDAEAVYALFSAPAREAQALSDLQDTLLDDDFYVHVEGYESSSVTEGGSFEVSRGVLGDDPSMPEDTFAELVAVVKYEGGFEGTLTATFMKEDGEWKVYAFNVTAPPGKINSP